MNVDAASYQDSLVDLFRSIRRKYRARLEESLRSLEKHFLAVLEDALSDVEKRLLSQAMCATTPAGVGHGDSGSVQSAASLVKQEEEEEADMPTSGLVSKPLDSSLPDDDDGDDDEEEEEEEDLHMPVPDYPDLHMCPDMLEEWFSTDAFASPALKSEPMDAGDTSAFLPAFPGPPPPAAYPPLPLPSAGLLLGEPAAETAFSHPPPPLKTEPPPAPVTSQQQQQQQAQWHACPDCGRKFRQHPKLRMHIASQHSGRNPYQCSICQRAFSRNDSLLRHLRTMHRVLVHDMHAGTAGGRSVSAEVS